MTFDLNNIINAGDVYAPPRILVYATHGLGKTSSPGGTLKPRCGWPHELWRAISF